MQILKVVLRTTHVYHFYKPLGYNDLTFNGEMYDLTNKDFDQIWYMR